MTNCKEKYHFECITCGKILHADAALYTCQYCSSGSSKHVPPSGILKTVYDYQRLKTSGVDFFRLREKGFIDLLPIQTFETMPMLRVGDTPLVRLHSLEKGVPLPYNLLLKDDSQNPTWSFKDRASALVSAFAREKGYHTIVTASTGNAGSSIAGICAAQRQGAVVLAPASAPAAKLVQIMMYGARLIPIDGTYDEAFDLSVEASEKFGWYNRNTAFNPFTIEGKKTVSFELYGQLKQQLPDMVFVPVGDGVILAGVYKGFEDLFLLGITDRMPVVVAVQAAGSSNLVANLERDVFVSSGSDTIADSISVDIPRNFYMAKDFLLRYKGEWITVSDKEILDASRRVAACAGLFTEPASAAAFAGYLRYHEQGLLPDRSDNVVLLTGSGLKDIGPLNTLLNIPPPAPPELKALEKSIKRAP